MFMSTNVFDGSGSVRPTNFVPVRANSFRLSQHASVHYRFEGCTAVFFILVTTGHTPGLGDTSASVSKAFLCSILFIFPPSTIRA